MFSFIRTVEAFWKNLISLILRKRKKEDNVNTLEFWILLLLAYEHIVNFCYIFKGQCRLFFNKWSRYENVITFHGTNIDV